MEGRCKKHRDDPSAILNSMGWDCCEVERVRELCRELQAEIERLRADRDDAREWHDDHCAMGCEPPWSKRALRKENK